MTKTINKISDDEIEVVETTESTSVQRYVKSILNAEKDQWNKRIADIDTLLNEFQ